MPATTTASVHSRLPSSRSPLSGRPAVVSVTSGLFALVTTEILPIGLLTSIGSSFAVSDGTAGLMMTMPGFLAAAAPAYWLVLTSRIMVGVTIDGFWSIGAGLAERLVPPASVGRATAVIFSAVPLGSVLGVPTGTFVGDLAGWRTAFTCMGVLTVRV